RTKPSTLVGTCPSPGEFDPCADPCRESPRRDVDGVRSQHEVHLLGRRPAEGRDDVAVRVEGEADLAVTERLHHDPWGDSLGEEKRGARVAEVVESLPWKTRGRKQRLEAAGHGDPVHWGPDAGREDEPALVVVPARSSNEPLGALSGPMSAEAFGDEGGQRHDPMARR